MRVITDSSALAKRYIQEKGSMQVQTILQETLTLAMSILVIPEISSALNRRKREKILSEDQYQQIKQQFSDDIHDAVILQITPGVIQHSVRLLEHHPLRAMDALHIASAIVWEAELFVTSDQRQFTAAEKEGLEARFIK